MSHPTWVRGLKPAGESTTRTLTSVAPYVGAWIETTSGHHMDTARESHPTWVRGLKPNMLNPMMSTEESHPTWVRGLKPWTLILLSLISWSHPTWVRGLKLFFKNGITYYKSRTLRGCVD